MKAQHSIRIGNSMAEIVSALNEADSWLGGLNASQKARFFVNLAIEELGTNWMKYGCPGRRIGTMTFHVRIECDSVGVRSVDDGTAFNPLDVPAPPTLQAPEDREIGGLGILLLRKMADHMSYEHRDGCNILTLEKTCPKQDHEQT